VGDETPARETTGRGKFEMSTTHASLALIGDALVMDGVAMFKATEALTPGRRMALMQDGFLEPDGFMRDASCEDTNYERGYDMGYEQGSKEAEHERKEAIIVALYEERQRIRKGINEFIKAHRLDAWMTETLRVELMTRLTEGLTPDDLADFDTPFEQEQHDD
jgi:hypothetical protein